jgi:hypothetical protein
VYRTRGLKNPRARAAAAGHNRACRCRLQPAAFVRAAAA